MTARAALTAGTALSVAVTAAWSLSATATVGPASPLQLTTGNLPGDYTQIASAPTGSSPWALYAATVAAYALCFLASGLRARRRARREAALDPEITEGAEVALATGGRH